MSSRVILTLMCTSIRENVLDTEIIVCGTMTRMYRNDKPHRATKSCIFRDLIASINQKILLVYNDISLNITDFIHNQSPVYPKESDYTQARENYVLCDSSLDGQTDLPS